MNQSEYKKISQIHADIHFIGSLLAIVEKEKGIDLSTPTKSFPKGIRDTVRKNLEESLAKTTKMIISYEKKHLTKEIV